MPQAHQEYVDFEFAKAKIEGGEHKPLADGVAIMIALALEGRSLVRKWARTYLHEKLNVFVADDLDATTLPTDRVS